MNSFVLGHVEDDRCDAELVRRALKNIDYDGDYRRFVSSDELMDYLNPKPQDNTATAIIKNTTQPRPPLSALLLDISLPGTDGKTILKTLKSDKKTQYLPVLMLSGSNSERDYLESMQLGCNGYLVKSVDFACFQNTVTHLIHAWRILSSQRFI